ncbi:carrier superfamily protein [Besnoitia besnoiti]|uniref:Carrier superfamily protein n=1 Tax=Besnoitia besnoiti TaxID=94643 RepID=A0A2A9MHN1_BESBE|nr:carrier superfamily protein [Besnoitia besnoiti]PFH37495.1 carrier superfamily protein [Besnoitia besnoiti]
MVAARAEERRVCSPPSSAESSSSLSAFSEGRGRRRPREKAPATAALDRFGLFSQTQSPWTTLAAPAFCTTGSVSRYEQLVAAIKEKHKGRKTKEKRRISEGLLLFLAAVTHGGTAALSRLLLAPLDQEKIIRQLSLARLPSLSPSSSPWSPSPQGSAVCASPFLVSESASPSSSAPVRARRPQSSSALSSGPPSSASPPSSSVSFSAARARASAASSAPNSSVKPPSAPAGASIRPSPSANSAAAFPTSGLPSASSLPPSRWLTVSSFWLGCSAPICAAIGGSWIRLALYQRTRLFFTDGEETYSNAERFFRNMGCICFSAFVALAVCYPLDVAHTAMCVIAASARQSGRVISSLDAFSAFSATSAPQGARREASVSFLSRRFASAKKRLGAQLTGTVTTGSARAETVDGEARQRHASARAVSPSHIVWRLYKQGGVRALYCGFGLCALTLVPFTLASAFLQLKFQSLLLSLQQQEGAVAAHWPRLFASRNGDLPLACDAPKGDGRGADEEEEDARGLSREKERSPVADETATAGDQGAAPRRRKTGGKRQAVRGDADETNRAGESASEDGRETTYPRGRGGSAFRQARGEIAHSPQTDSFERKRHEEREETLGSSRWKAAATAAFAAGLVAQLATYPLDSIRRRQQFATISSLLFPHGVAAPSRVQPPASPMSVHPPKPVSGFRRFFVVPSSRAWFSKPHGGLFRGAGVLLVRSVPECAIAVSVYSFLMSKMPSLAYH